MSIYKRILAPIDGSDAELVARTRAVPTLLVRPTDAGGQGPERANAPGP